MVNYVKCKQKLLYSSVCVWGGDTGKSVCGRGKTIAWRGDKVGIITNHVNCSFHSPSEPFQTAPATTRHLLIQTSLSVYYWCCSDGSNDKWKGPLTWWVEVLSVLIVQLCFCGVQALQDCYCQITPSGMDLMYGEPSLQ